MPLSFKRWTPARARRRIILAYAAMWIPIACLWLLRARGTHLSTIVVTCFFAPAMLLIVVVWTCVEIRLVYRLRNFLRRGEAICFECGYRVDNVGAASENCPECGYSIEESKVRTEQWVTKNLRFCFWPFTLLEPRDDDEGEPPT